MRLLKRIWKLLKENPILPFDYIKPPRCKKCGSLLEEQPGNFKSCPFCGTVEYKR